jgi:mono/diheme cytochrome c family protein
MMGVAGSGRREIEAGEPKVQRYKPYIIGFLIAIILIWIILFIYVHYGFLDFRADGPTLAVADYFYAGAMPRWAARYSPRTGNPLPLDDATIVSGIKIYRNHCALCHGSPQQPWSEIGRGFFPPAPQYMREPPGMPDNQNYWVVKHGIARSGMPAFGRVLSDGDIWRVVALLNRYQNIERLWGPAQQDAVVVRTDAPATAAKPAAPAATTTETVAAKPPLATTTTAIPAARPSAVAPRSTTGLRLRRRWRPTDNPPPAKNTPADPYVY